MGFPVLFYLADAVREVAVAWLIPVYNTQWIEPHVGWRGARENLPVTLRLPDTPKTGLALHRAYGAILPEYRVGSPIAI